MKLFRLTVPACCISSSLAGCVPGSGTIGGLWREMGRQEEVFADFLCFYVLTISTQSSF